MAINRRDFISTAAGALAFSGCSSAAKVFKNPEPKFIWSYLAHFGVNSWRDVPLETQDPKLSENIRADQNTGDEISGNSRQMQKFGDAREHQTANKCRSKANQISFHMKLIPSFPKDFGLKGLSQKRRPL